MIGLDSYIGTKRSFVGFDWMNLTSGLLKGAGGAMGGQAGGGGESAAAAAEKARLEEQRKAAEQSANNWKMAAIAVGVLVVGFFVFRPKPTVAV